MRSAHEARGAHEVNEHNHLALLYATSTRGHSTRSPLGIALHTGTGLGERDAEVASAASVHSPTPLHAPELVHGLYVPATSTCYGISSASGDSSPAGDTTPRRRYCCRELCSATTPLYLRGLTTSLSAASLGSAADPEGLGGGLSVKIRYAIPRLLPDPSSARRERERDYRTHPNSGSR